MSRRRDRGSVLHLILELASRPEGVTTADMIARLQCQPNAPILPNAQKAGHIFKAERKGCKVRWFATTEAAAAWVALGPVVKPPKKRRGRPPKVSTQARPAEVKAKKPRHVPVPKDHQKPPTYNAGSSKIARPTSGEPIITSATRVTIAPTPAPRFHVPADHRGDFSLAGVGRDVQTGRGWA